MKCLDFNNIVDSQYVHNPRELERKVEKEFEKEKNLKANVL